MPNEYRLYYQWDVEVDSQLTPLAVRNSDIASTRPDRYHRSPGREAHQAAFLVGSIVVREAKIRME